MVLLSWMATPLIADVHNNVTVCFCTSRIFIAHGELLIPASTPRPYNANVFTHLLRTTSTVFEFGCGIADKVVLLGDSSNGNRASGGAGDRVSLIIDGLDVTEVLKRK
jgi:hypothetical protein